MSRGDPVGADELEAVRRLRILLADVGYAQLYHQTVARELFTNDVECSLRAVAALDEPERTTLLLLGLGVPVPWDPAGNGDPSPLAGAVSALCAAGLAREAGGMVRTEGWVVVPALRGLLMTGVPPIYEAAELLGAPAYVGFESLTLAAVLPPTRGRRVLDIGAGCGIQGLLAASGASGAVLTDVDPTSLKMAALNAILNDVAHPVEFRQGSLYEPVRGERFDLVVSLPPYVPTPPGSAVSVSAAGGPDGLSFVRGLVRGASAALADGGELVALCQLLCDGEGPLLARELGELAPDLHSRMVLGDWHPLQPYVVELSTRLARRRGSGGEAERRALVERYSGSLRAIGATGVCSAVLRLRRPAALHTAPSAARVRVLGDAPEVRAGDVPVTPAPLRTGEATGWLAASTGPGSAALVDGPSAALLGAVDGVRSIGEAAEVAWGHPPGAGRADLVDQAIHRLMEARRQGLVEWGHHGRGDDGR